jgi:proteasome lid subunit RPN8/RPN11
LGLFTDSIQAVRSYLAAAEWRREPAIATLRELHQLASTQLQHVPFDAYVSRRNLNWLVGELTGGEERIARISDGPTVTASRMEIPTEVLYQLHQSLFPAERMFVAAGRRDGAATKLSAVFDVTGEWSGASVRADSERLARALIAMEQTGTFLAAWVHSHPGRGPGATRPSHIDLAQQADWIRDFGPNLVSAIFVQDRWLRFWGPAVENDRVRVDLVGYGAERQENHDYLYKLTH